MNNIINNIQKKVFVEKSIPSACPEWHAPPAKELNIKECLPDGDFPEYCQAVADQVGMSVDAVALFSLSCISLATAGAAVFELVKGGHAEEAPIWVLCLAPPSERKTSVFKEVTRPLIQWDRAYQVELAPALGIWKAQREGDRARIRKLDKALAEKKGIGKDASYDEMELRNERDELAGTLEKEPAYALSQSMAEDCTSEALADIMQNSPAIGLYSDEGSLIEVALGRYNSGNTNVGLLNKAWSGSEAIINRRNRDTPLIIEKPLVTLGLFVQPTMLHEVAKNRKAVGVGFLARFLISTPQSRLGERKSVFDAPVIPERLNAWWSTTIKKIMDLPHNNRLSVGGEYGIHLSDVEPQKVQCSPEARKILQAFHDGYEPRLAECCDLQTGDGWGGKLEGQIWRICLALHMIQGGGDSISGETAQRAVAWEPFLVKNYKMALRDCVLTEEERGSVRLHKHIARRWPDAATFTEREAFTWMKGSTVPNMDIMRPILDHAASEGHIQELDMEGDGKNGRPDAQAYSVVIPE